MASKSVRERRRALASRVAGAERVRAYCDGSYLPKSGRGGWGFRMEAVWRQGRGPLVVEESGGVRHAESAIDMEVRAIVEVLRTLQCFRGRVCVVSDMKDLVLKLRRCGQREAAVRLALWRHEGLVTALRIWRGPAVEWRWVKSHSGNAAHDAAHHLARGAARRLVGR